MDPAHLDDTICLCCNNISGSISILCSCWSALETRSLRLPKSCHLLLQVGILSEQLVDFIPQDDRHDCEIELELEVEKCDSHWPSSAWGWPLLSMLTWSLHMSAQYLLISTLYLQPQLLILFPQLLDNSVIQVLVIAWKKVLSVIEEKFDETVHLLVPPPR